MNFWKDRDSNVWWSDCESCGYMLMDERMIETICSIPLRIFGSGIFKQSAAFFNLLFTFY